MYIERTFKLYGKAKKRNADNEGVQVSIDKKVIVMQ